MGNTPSHPHGSPAVRPPHSSPSTNQHVTTNQSNRTPTNLRLPMPQRPTHISPQSSNPTSPSGRPGSPRRRKSLELPDLNKLSFTPAAPIPTTATTTSHHLAPSTGDLGSSSRKWHQSLGGHRSPLSGANALTPMSKMDAAVPPPKTNYFPTQPIPIISPRPIEPPSPTRPARTGVTPPPPTVAPTPVPYKEEEPNDGLVAVPIQWTGGGKQVYVTGNFANNWKDRFKLNRSTHDFHTTLRLAPGTYRLKFIVDESWRCSKQIPTAADDDGTLVNWIEVEAAKTEEELKAEWALDAKTAAKPEDDDDQWTNVIPPPLTCYQYLEELPTHYTHEELVKLFPTAYLTSVPQPPQLPRILEKVILNADPKKPHDLERDSAGQPGMGWGSAPPAGLDDNSILAVPNHVVLNHLTASAIKNGTLGVGTTTRYRKKYITTMFFKPTPGDLFDQSTEQAA